MDHLFDLQNEFSERDTNRDTRTANRDISRQNRDISAKRDSRDMGGVGGGLSALSREINTSGSVTVTPRSVTASVTPSVTVGDAEKGRTSTLPSGAGIRPGASCRAAKVGIVRVFAVDPGTTESGWCLFDSTGRVADSGVASNYDVLRWVKAGGSGSDVLAVEMIAGMGMTVGQTTFETVRWIGRFQQAWADPEAVRLVFRREVKTCICGNQQAKDGNIRQALIDRLGEPGKKAKPGPTYGVSSHAWSALGVAVTALERMGIKVEPKQQGLV